MNWQFGNFQLKELKQWKDLFYFQLKELENPILILVSIKGVPPRFLNRLAGQYILSIITLNLLTTGLNCSFTLILLVISILLIAFSNK